MTAAEVVYIRRLLEAMGYEQKSPTPLHVDNKASEAVAKDPVLNNGMKHVARRHYYAKEIVSDGEIEVTWVETKLNLADALTKALALPQFVALVARMRRLQVYGGRALSAMRAVMGWVSWGRAANGTPEEAAAPLLQEESPEPEMTPEER